MLLEFFKSKTQTQQATNGQHITAFKSGDIVTRVMPIGTDMSYIGTPLRIVSCTNGLINLVSMPTPGSRRPIEAIKPVQLPQFRYGDGWELYDFKADTDLNDAVNAERENYLTSK